MFCRYLSDPFVSSLKERERERKRVHTHATLGSLHLEILLYVTKDKGRPWHRQCLVTEAKNTQSQERGK